MELRTVILWALWIERNDKVFNNVLWTPEKMLQVVWLGITDYGRMEWSSVKLKAKTNPDDTEKNFAVFKERRGREEVFAVFIDDKPRWQPKGPAAGFVFEPH